MKNEIVRGTTPSIYYKFTYVDLSYLSKAIMVVKSYGRIVIEKTLEDARIEGDTIIWRLEQEETLRLSVNTVATVVCDWLLQDDTRGRSNAADFFVTAPGKNEVI